MNIFERLRKERHPDENYPEKSWSVADLVRAFKELNPQSKIDRNKINRIENGSQSPDTDTLIAYSKVFNVSVDYLLGLSPSKIIDEDIRMICNYTGLSDEAITEIKKLSYLDKMILDKMICNYCLFSNFIKNTKRILAFNAFHSDVRIVFNENAKKFDRGIAILENTINSSDITRLLYGTIDNNIHNLLDCLTKDKELTDIITTHFLESSVKNLWLADDMPNLKTLDETAESIVKNNANKVSKNNTKEESNDNETT
ncbi:MAG: helix-turn-helix domain-containing protein [Bacteroidales bacterium]|nr:helix-turn-helix domain-containing protein [Lachnoclostridium sp.]MCM1384500.1 helix-turn-helix domain-containing protein [Lachnoclostridium sp.]MCM1464044.1 helix-turn-helix domain-containing protein [Bacteroidales bacterium]